MTLDYYEKLKDLLVSIRIIVSGDEMYYVSTLAIDIQNQSFGIDKVFEYEGGKSI